MLLKSVVKLYLTFKNKYTSFKKALHHHRQSFDRPVDFPCSHHMNLTYKGHCWAIICIIRKLFHNKCSI